MVPVRPIKISFAPRPFIDHFKGYTMDIAGIREALHKQPFEPFAIGLADGRSLPVPHPDLVALTPRRAIVGRRR